jgi:hypothetical protein
MAPGLGPACFSFGSCRVCLEPAGGGFQKKTWEKNMKDPSSIPCKQTQLWKITMLFMGKSTISMAIFP